MAEQKKDKIEFVQATFAGPAAALALLAIGEDRPKKALDLARKLLARGASEAHIYAETNKLLDGSPYAGVSYTADGQPRFEISDEAAKTRPVVGRDGRALMGDFLDHERYFEAYPEARYLEVEKRGNKGGGYTGDKVLVGEANFAKAALGGRSIPKDSATGVVLHELDHYAQDAENFPRGGSPRDFEKKFPGDDNRETRVRLYESLAGEVDAENTRRRQKMTAKQRRATHPDLTAAMSRSEQIVTDQSGSIVEKFGGELPKGYTVEADVNPRSRQANYTIFHKAGPLSRRKQVGTAYVRDTPNGPQVGRISIADRHQRKGIATALYAQIERDHGGKPVIPDSTLSPKAAAFWRKHKPEALREHVDIGDGSLMWDPMGMMQRAGAKPESEPNSNRARLQEQADALEALLGRPKPNDRLMEMADDIKDFGEKIGGARKDRAVKTGPRGAKAAADDRPSWMKRFVAAETIDRQTQKGSGQWTLLDTRKKSRYGSPAATRQTFASQAEAERAIPLIAVSQNHRVSATRDGQYNIVRSTTKGYTAAAGGQTFPSREAAMRYMAENAASLLAERYQQAYGDRAVIGATAPGSTAMSERQGWSDAAREASAEVRAANAKDPSVLSAVERAMKASEARAKPAPSQLAEPPKTPTRVSPESPAKPQTVAALKAEAKAAGIKGYSSMTKSALMKALDKSGAIAMIAAPAVAAAVAYDATKAEAAAAGDANATAKGVAAGATAGAVTGAVVYGIGKAIGAGITAVARVAPAAAGPVGLAVAGGLTAYGAYKAYQDHKATGKGATAAALSLVGADQILHLGQRAPPGPVRLTQEQQAQYAAAAQRFAAMKQAANTLEPAKRQQGWSNAARIAAAKARGVEKLPYDGNPSAGPAKWAAVASTAEITAAMKK